MREQIERFLIHLTAEEESSGNTVAAYRNDLNQLMIYLESYRGPFGEEVTAWPQVDKAVVQSYLLDLNDRGYASTTVARKIAATKGFFDYLRRTHVIVEDPAADVSSPKVKKHVPQTIPPEDVDKLLAAPAASNSPQSLRDLALMETLYATGVRVTELVNLDVENIDLDRGQVKCGAAGRRQRSVPIGASTVDALSRYLANGRPHLVISASEPALFLNHRGQRLTRQGLWLIIKRYVREVGIEDTVTPHTLRHSFAAHLLNSGAKLREVKERLGHASLSTTQVYRQVASDNNAEIVIDGRTVKTRAT
jgi:integrase/recombinase XerD